MFSLKLSSDGYLIKNWSNFVFFTLVVVCASDKDNDGVKQNQIRLNKSQGINYREKVWSVLPSNIFRDKWFCKRWPERKNISDVLIEK